jgi:outer membrane protein assembly factor BamB
MSSDVSIRAEFGLDRYELVWVVPVSSTSCVEVKGIAVGERVVVAGDIALTGTSPTRSSNQGGSNGFVAALRRQTGELAWTTPLGDKGVESASTPQVLSSGEVIAVKTIFTQTAPGLEQKLLWLDGDSGQLLASTAMSDQVKAIHPLADGGFVVLTEGSSQVVRFGPATRTAVWTQRLTASGFVSAEGIVATGRDLVVAAVGRGIASFSIPLGRGPPMATQNGAFLLRLDGGTGVPVSGRWLDARVVRHVTSMAMHGPVVALVGAERGPPRQAFVTGLSVDGSALWEHVYGRAEDTAFPTIHSVASSADGFVVAGSTSDRLDLGRRQVGERHRSTTFLAELSPTGELLWTFAWPLARPGIAVLATDRDGDLYVAGSFINAFEIAGHRVEPASISVPCVSSFVARFTRTGDRSPGL